MRGFHLAGLVLDRPREGASGVAEQLAGQQLFRERRGMHDDERSVRARAARVEEAGEDALARAVLPAQQDRRLRAGGPAHRVERGLERGRAGGQLELRHRVRELPFEVAHLAHEGAPLRRPFHQVPDLGGRERLGQVVDGAATHRLHRRIDRRVRGDDDDVETRTGRHQLGDEVEAGALGEFQVDEGEIEDLPRSMRQRRFRVGGQADRAARALEGEGERRSDVLLVVDDEDAKHG